MNRIRLWVAALAIVALAAVSCVSPKLPDGADYRHRYFAALADYNQAKRAALAYVQLESTPVTHTARVVEIVNAADHRVRQFEDLRRAGRSLQTDYTRVSVILEAASVELLEYVARRAS